MAKKDHLKCISCEEFYHMDEMLTSYYGSPLCEGCESDDMTSGCISVILPDPDDSGENTCYMGTHTRYTDPAWNTLVGEDVINDWMDTVKWKNTDGWRGHYVTGVPEGYERIIDGWSSGGWGSGTTAVNDFEDMWKNEHEQFAGIDMFVAVMPTSNVFSMTVEVYVHKRHLDAFKRIILGDPEVFECELKDVATDKTSWYTLSYERWEKVCEELDMDDEIYFYVEDKIDLWNVKAGDRLDLDKSFEVVSIND
tara:strand:+ start:24201 stop:24956 length:756 start_codon:yes stop_codon:yes gene_type:complete